jgi:redox-regulated HSP33 family molecular chaperone
MKTRELRVPCPRRMHSAFASCEHKIVEQPTMPTHAYQLDCPLCLRRRNKFPSLLDKSISFAEYMTVGASAVLALKSRDAATKVITKCGGYRLTTVTCSSILRETIKRHKLMELTANNTNFLERLGQCIAFTNCLAATLQKEERVELKYTSNECTTAVDSMALGECRARVYNSDEHATPHTLRVSRVLYNNAQPVVSVTKATLEECAERLELIFHNKNQQTLTPALLEVAESYLEQDFAPHAFNFMAKSEGSLDTALFLSAIVDMETDTVTCCGGMLHAIALADASASTALGRSLLRSSLNPNSSDLLRKLVVESSRAGALTQTILSLMTGDEEGAAASCVHTRQHALPLAGEHSSDEAALLLRKSLLLLHQEDNVGKSQRLVLDSSTAEKTLLDFFCRCSKKDLLQHLKSLPRERLEDMRRNSGGVVESTCAACKKVHKVGEEDWKELLS